MHRRYRVPHRAPRGRRYSGTDFVMPFLIIICVGVIVVLIFNLWKALFNHDVERAAYMHIVEGSAQMKTWGTDDFFNLTSDAVIMQGDELVTSGGAKVILEFFDGTIVRLDGSTDVSFVEIDDSKQAKISMLLVNGKLWVNKLYNQSGDTNLIVKTSNLEFVSQNESIFELENTTDESVRVIQGMGKDVAFNVFDAEGAKFLETDMVGVGQQAVFNDAVLASYRDFKSPTVVSAIADDFRTALWYSWNIEQDKNPVKFDKSVIGTSFVKVDPQEIQGSEESLIPVPEQMPVTTDIEQDVSPEPTATPEATNVALEKPTIVSVGGVKAPNADGFYVVDANPALLAGTVSGADKVVVNGFTLQRFKSGTTGWSYYANADYGLMKEGENTYEIVSYAADGSKSESLFVKVLYQPKKVESAPAEPAADSESDTSAPVEESKAPAL